MKRLAPQMTALRQRHAHDKQRLNQELMALYKREGVNPLSGCLPMLLQIPVFFALYKVLLISIEMRHAPFFGWIKDLSAKDPSNVFTLFGLHRLETAGAAARRCLVGADGAVPVSAAGLEPATGRSGPDDAALDVSDRDRDLPGAAAGRRADLLDLEQPADLPAAVAHPALRCKAPGST